MTYQVLARKWRPKKFADLVGQQHVVKALVNALDKGQLHHAYLLTGTRGVGKTTIARILAKSLNCIHAVHGEPCGQCDSCQQIDAGRFVDVLEIDAASNTGIDHIREVLENAQYAPTLGQYKVYIIDEVHMLSKSAFNAMLKTLEEPPAHVKFILATTDPQKVPVTVLSRCLQFVLRNLDSRQIYDHLIHVLETEGVTFEEAALNLLSRAAAGSMRDALSLLDQAIAMGSGTVVQTDVRNMIGAVDKSYLYDLLFALAERDGHTLLSKAAEMARNAIGFDGALNELAMILQQLSLIQLVPTAIDKNDPEYHALKQLCQLFSAEQLQLYYQCVLRGKSDLPLAPEEYAGFVMTLLRMLAFAPLAAEAQPLAGQISGSQLHNPYSVETDQMDHSADYEQSDVPSQPIKDSADVADSESLTKAELQPSNQFTDAKPIRRESHADSSVTAELMPVEKDVIKNTEEVNENVCIPPVSFEVTTEELPFPALTATNWDIILKKLAPRLGAVQLFSQHTAIKAFDQTSGKLVLALTEQGELTADKIRLDRLGSILSEVYGQTISIQTQSWQNEETPQMLHQRQQLENQQQAQQILEANKTIQSIIDTFEAKWVLQSLQLKSN